MQQHSGQVISLDRERTPNISDSAWLAPGSIVTGAVTLADDVSVWYNAVLRGDSGSICVGERSNLQDGVVVHVDKNNDVVIGSGVSVGHNAVIHGAQIGDDTLIGMNSTILSGAVIGEHCLVAAGALVPQGKIVAAGSLIAGVPAKIVRALSSAEIAELRANSEAYLRHAADHKRAVREMQ